MMIGVAILPYSLLGLVFIIGIAGFTPFLTVFVFLRNGIRAFRTEPSLDRGPAYAIALMAAIITIGLPALSSYQLSSIISRSVNDLLYGDANQSKAAAEQLRWVPLLPTTSSDEIVKAYGREQDAQKKEILKNFYQDATGEDIERRLMILND
jgi:hypothetical protein